MKRKGYTGTEKRSAHHSRAKQRAKREEASQGKLHGAESNKKGRTYMARRATLEVEATLSRKVRAQAFELKG